VPVPVELLLVVGIAVVFLVIAIVEFRRAG